MESTLRAYPGLTTSSSQRTFTPAELNSSNLSCHPPPLGRFLLAHVLVPPLLEILDSLLESFETCGRLSPCIALWIGYLKGSFKGVPHSLICLNVQENKVYNPSSHLLFPLLFLLVKGCYTSCHKHILLYFISLLSLLTIGHRMLHSPLIAHFYKKQGTYPSPSSHLISFLSSLTIGQRMLHGMECIR